MPQGRVAFVVVASGGHHSKVDRASRCILVEPVNDSIDRPGKRELSSARNTFTIQRSPIAAEGVVHLTLLRPCARTVLTIPAGTFVWNAGNFDPTNNILGPNDQNYISVVSGLPMPMNYMAMTGN